jgi:hypothetical protein
MTMANEHSYEVLSPWAEADPVSLKGITSRLTDLSDKKVGLFCNSKRAAVLILNEVERKLKERYPPITTSWYEYTEVNVPEIETKNSAKFQEWVKGVDGVILAVGD